MLVLLLLVVLLFLPVLDVVSIPDDHMEVGVQQQNGLVFHLLLLQTDRRWVGLLDRVAKKRRLDNRNAMLHSLTVQRVDLVSELI